MSLSTTAASGVGAVLRFAIGALLMTLLGRERFGTYVEATTLALLLALVGSFGVSPGLVPFVAAARAEGRGALRALALRTLGQVLLVSAPLAAALALLAPWIAGSLFSEPELAGMLRLLSPLVVLGAVGSGCAAVLRGVGATAQHAWLEQVLLTGLVLLLSGAAAASGAGESLLVGAVMVGTLLGTLAQVALVMRRVPAGDAPSGPPVTTGAVLRESVPLMGSALLAFLITWMDVFFVGLLRGPEEVGGYGAAVRLLLAATLVHEAVGQVFVGRMGELFLRRDWPAIRSLYRATCVWTSWSAAGVVLLLVVWAPQVLGLFGEDYAASAGVLVVLAGARLVKTLTGHSGLLIVTTRRVRLHLFNALVLLASNAALNAAWVPEHGAEGAAAATLASVCLGNLLFLVEGQLFLSLLPFSARSLAAPALALSIGLVVWPLRGGAGGDLGWLLPAGAVALLWAGLAYAIALREPERRALVGLLRRPGARGEAAA